MDQNKETPTKRPLWFEKFSIVATVMGFIADTKEIISIILSIIAMASVLWSAGSSNENHTIVFTQIQITPFHILGLWILSAYIYLTLLRSEWIKNRYEKGYKSSFTGFVWRDIIVGLKKPLLSVLSITFILFLIWIYTEIVFFFGGSYFVAATIILTILVIAAIGQVQTSKSEADLARVKKVVDNEWDKFDGRIQSELKLNWYVNIATLADWAKLLDVEQSALEYALTKYKAAHPKQVAYAFVYDRSDNQSVFNIEINDKKYPLKVLVALKMFDHNKYYYSVNEMTVKYVLGQKAR